MSARKDAGSEALRSRPRSGQDGGRAAQGAGAHDDDDDDDDASDARFDARYAAALRAPDAVAAVRALAVELGVHVDEDGVRLAALLVARLRFERVVRGDPSLARAFDDEPEEFARAFKEYHAATPPTAMDPRAEAASFAAWWTERGAPS